MLWREWCTNVKNLQEATLQISEQTYRQSFGKSSAGKCSHLYQVLQSRGVSYPVCQQTEDKRQSIYLI